MKQHLLIVTLLIGTLNLWAQHGSHITWQKHSDVAQYKGASWDNLVKREANVSLDQAYTIAEADPNITFFFIMKRYMYLEGRGAFRRGDAVFFSGKPWYGSAPGMADAYEKQVKHHHPTPFNLPVGTVKIEDNMLTVLCEQLYWVQILTDRGHMVLETVGRPMKELHMDLNFLRSGSYDIRVENMQGVFDVYRVEL